MFMVLATVVAMSSPTKSTPTKSTGAGKPAWSYPASKKTDVVDDYFGTKVADPYRWLEDDNAADTKGWVAEQNKLTQKFLSDVKQREQIQKRLTELWNYERFQAPEKAGDEWLYFHNNGLQNQAVLYATKSLTEQGRVLLDPNTLSTDGTVALSNTALSKDGTLMAYSLSESGSDWRTWKVRNVKTGKDLPDTIKWSKFSGASWMKDGSGFFYARFDEPKTGDELKGVVKFQKLYFHKIGTEQAADVLIHERKDQPDWGFGGEVTHDGRYLVISQSEGTERKNRLFLKRLDVANALTTSKVEPFLDGFDASYGVVGNDGDTFYVQTDKNAPRYRLVAIDKTKGADEKAWKELIPEGPNKQVLEQVALLGNQFVAIWMKDAHELINTYDLTGKLVAEVPMPGIGALKKLPNYSKDLSGERESNDVFFTFVSFNYPETTFRYDVATKQMTQWKQGKVAIKPEDYETTQVFYKSKDGTEIPMFVVSKKGMKKDSKRPTYLYGYGGFNNALLPGFSPAIIAWLDMGGVYAQPSLRGGGEYGKAWHDAGRLDQKQNVFDDFIAAGEWLIANKYTQPSKLAIGGGSNGGLLVGACLVQRPDLFGAAVPAVGVLDMLRFHKFTIGWAWKSDYGSSETKPGFDTLYKYSPLHNVKPGVKYPATMVVTADHDDRVVPAHSHKFTATLQAAQAGPSPILTRIDSKAGHGAGKPVAKQIEERADIWSFLLKVLDAKS
jgi:prolyl oligopeptidase